jgi:hypothetical protein
MTIHSRRIVRIGQTFLCSLLTVLALSWLAGCSKDSFQDVLRSLLEKQRLVEQTRLNLLLAVEAEKNAVLTPTETGAAMFIEQARKAMGTARDNLASLVALIDKGHDAKEGEAVAAVSADFEELTAVDAAILRMAGRNTNLRASLLSRNEAATETDRFQQALAPIADGPDCPAAREALRAVAASLTILSLHARHIEEEAETAMDSLETDMERQNRQVEAALERLTKLLPPDDASLAEAKTAYAAFWRVTGEILKLSRENSNINALALVMGRKRLLTAKCLDDLAALHTVLASKEFKATR